MSDEPIKTYHNWYKCPRCNHEWEDEWDCGCDDDCPECGCRHISPVKSERICYLVVVVNVEGLVNQVELCKDTESAVELAVKLALEQCSVGETEVRGQLGEDLSFTSPDGNIIISIFDAPIPG